MPLLPKTSHTWVFKLMKPLLVQLAIQGSHAKINFGCHAQLKYQHIQSERYFDVINLLNYDLILGTLFLFQHKVMLGLNLTTLIIGSDSALPIKGKQVCILQLHTADMLEDALGAAQWELCKYVAPICKEASDSLSPLVHNQSLNSTNRPRQGLFLATV